MLIEKYLDILESAGKKQQTIKVYRAQLKHFFNWLISQRVMLDPEQITRAELTEYVTFLQNKGMKPASINTATGCIAAFYAWLRNEGYINHNPALKLRMEQTEKIRWLSKHERIKLIQVAAQEKNKRNTAIVLTLLMSGITAAEIVNLKPTDVVLQESKGYIIIGSGESNKKRSIPIPKTLRACLEDYLIRGKAASKWLFDSQRGEQLSYDGIYQVCRALGEAAGIEGLSPQILRHTYGHDLMERGVNPGAVGKVMGIESKRVLRYAHSEEDLQQAVEVLNVIHLPEIAQTV